jgi:CubicO group peptidase (beta-lactamase class C family)
MGAGLSEVEALARRHFPRDDEPGAAVLVSLGDDVVLCEGYGIADMTTAAPITPETAFRLASVTKQFTAMCVMLLRHDGRLSYDDRLTTLLPDFPAYGASITVRQLLHHTSGLKDYEDMMPPGETTQVLDRDVLEMMKSAPGPDFVPGSQYHYSNSGYVVLAMIVERVSRARYAEFLRRRIFEPLGMNGSVAYEKGVSEVPRRAMGYKEENGAFHDADQSPTSAVLGDGGIYTSVLDYRKWDGALYTDQLVPQARLAEALTPGTLSDGRPTTYGFGWMIDEDARRRVIFHTGSTSGFNNCVRRIPERRQLVVVLCNRRGEQSKQLALEIEELMLTVAP